jgi:hypothetical protein
MNAIDTNQLYKASAKSPVLVDVPKMPYLTIDGSGYPGNSPEFQQAIEALYGIAYTIKFSRKKRGEESGYRIPPLEGLWWSEDIKDFQPDGDKSKWQWTLMIAQPEFITKKEFEDARKALLERKPGTLRAKDVKLSQWKEGPSVQVLHVGPYSEEGPTIERLMAFAQEYGELTGKHHEIYLGDPRRARPDRLETIIRHPVKLRSKKRAVA